MFFLAPKKSKRGTRLKYKVHNGNEDNEHSADHTNHEIKEVFVGHRTVFSVIGITVGAILVGRSLWEYGRMYVGIPITILCGLVIFVICGLVLEQFRG